MTHTERIEASTTKTLRDGRTVTIRPIAESDRAALQAFGENLPAKDSLYLEDDFQNPEITTRLANAAAAEHWRQFVAQAEDGTIAGYTSVRQLPGWSAHVADIYLVVAEDWRHAGLGSILAEKIFAAARNLQAAKVIVQMLDDQVDGKDIFHHLGFQVEGTLRKHACDRNGKFHDLLILSYHMDQKTA